MRFVSQQATAYMKTDPPKPGQNTHNTTSMLHQPELHHYTNPSTLPSAAGKKKKTTGRDGSRDTAWDGFYLEGDASAPWSAGKIRLLWTFTYHAYMHMADAELCSALAGLIELEMHKRTTEAVREKRGVLKKAAEVKKAREALRVAIFDELQEFSNLCDGDTCKNFWNTLITNLSYRSYGVREYNQNAQTMVTNRGIAKVRNIYNL